MACMSIHGFWDYDDRMAVKGIYGLLEHQFPMMNRVPPDRTILSHVPIVHLDEEEFVRIHLLPVTMEPGMNGNYVVNAYTAAREMSYISVVSSHPDSDAHSLVTMLWGDNIRTCNIGSRYTRRSEIFYLVFVGPMEGVMANGVAYGPKWPVKLSQPFLKCGPTCLIDLIDKSLITTCDCGLPGCRGGGFEYHNPLISVNRFIVIHPTVREPAVPETPLEPWEREFRAAQAAVFFEESYGPRPRGINNLLVFL